MTVAQEPPPVDGITPEAAAPEAAMAPHHAGPNGAGPHDAGPHEAGPHVEPAVAVVADVHGDVHVVAEPHRRVRLYVWQIPVRVTHWLTAITILTLSVTGLYIADPFLIPAGGDLFSVIRFIHIVSALLFLLSGLLRTYWLLAGNRFSRWSAFIPTTMFQATELFRQAGFYGFIRREIPKVLGHNQLAATAYVALFALLLVEVVTGFALDGLMGGEPGATLFAWLRELVGSQTLRLVHHLAMWGILAIALFHVYSCILVDHLEHNGLISSIISGFKFPTREEIVESRDGGVELLDRTEP